MQINQNSETLLKNVLEAAMDISSPQAVAAIVAGLVSVATSFITAVLTERRMRRDYRLEFAAERVAKKLLNHRDYHWRTFITIRHFLGGFEDDELRRILVRAGAIRAMRNDGEEIWGLLDRNPDVQTRQRIGMEHSCQDRLPETFEGDRRRSRRGRYRGDPAPALE